MVSVRPDLTFLSGYHSPQVDVPVRLNTNESPFQPPAGFVEELSGCLSDLAWNRYPDRSATALRTALAERHGVAPSQIFVANGSNEVLQTLSLTFAGPGRAVACFEPGYQMHGQIARVTGASVVSLDRETDFSLDADAVARFLGAHRPSVVFLSSPNNPTGLSEPSSMVDVVLDSCDALLVVDEAYAEFGRWTAIDRIQDGVPLVVSRTFSKTWSMAAARLGYLVGPTEVVDSLWNTVLPYHVSAFTQKAGLLALNFVEEMNDRVEMITAERSRLQSGLSELNIAFVPSDANFVLFSAENKAATELWTGLVARGVLVRDCSGWPRLNSWLRVTVGTPAENDAFLRALKEVIHG